jgi:TPR repeat protein
LIAAGLAGLVVLGGGGYFAYSLLKNHGSDGPNLSACPRENLDDFLTRKPSPDQLLAAGKSCRDSATVANNAEWVALVARLCRAAGDAGKAEGALCLGELYDPKEAKPGRLGQMPAADFALAFDNYRRAAELGSTEARTKLTELRAFVEVKARDGDSEAARLIEKWPQ